MRHVASRLPSFDTPSEQKTSNDEEVSKKEIQGESDEFLASGTSEEDRLEHLYEQIAWPLGKKYGHPYDAFKLSLS